MNWNETKFGSDWIQSREFDLRRMVRQRISTLAVEGSEKSIACKFDKELPDSLVGPQKAVGELLTVVLHYAWERLYRGELEIELRCSRATELSVDVELIVSSRLTQWSRFDPIAQQCRFRNSEDDGLSVQRIQSLCTLLGVGLNFGMSPMGDRIVASGITLSYPDSSYGNPSGKRTASLYGRRLLFVEDNALYRSVLLKHFNRWGLEVEAVGDAESAIEAIENGGVFEFGVFDVSLPGLSGHELASFCRERERARAMRIVALSGLPRDCEESFFDANLVKPVVPELLRQTLGAFPVESN